MSTGVAVVHHKGIVVEGVVSLVGRTEGFEVVERIGAPKRFKDYLPGPEVGILVLGAGEPGAGLDGPAIAGRARSAQHAPRVIGVFNQDNLGRISAMARQAIHGYIQEDALSDLLPVALQAVRDGRLFVCPRLLPQMQGLLSRGNGQGDELLPMGLTERQAAILRLLVTGDQYGEIAEKLDIEISTISSPVQNIRRRLGLRSRTALVAFAMKHGF